MSYSGATGYGVRLLFLFLVEDEEVAPVVGAGAVIVAFAEAVC